MTPVVNVSVYIAMPGKATKTIAAFWHGNSDMPGFSH